MSLDCESVDDASVCDVGTIPRVIELPVHGTEENLYTVSWRTVSEDSSNDWILVSDIEGTQFLVPIPPELHSTTRRREERM